MLSEIDILSINCPATSEARHLIDERRLGLMKRDAFIINTARGDIIDQDALIAALERDAIGGAGLDVYVGEPDIDPRLLTLRNVVLLPHMGSATLETRTAMGEKVIANIVAWARGENPPDCC
jgi:glyoxylate reductase